MSHLFRPMRQPARRFYDAIEDEALKRPERYYKYWIQAERDRMMAEAQAYAQETGLTPPPLSVVESAERCAKGHADYTAKWAIGVARYFEKQQKATNGTH